VEEDKKWESTPNRTGLTDKELIYKLSWGVLFHGESHFSDKTENLFLATSACT
jgi:hypothetical protein